MKILHTADWHMNEPLGRIDRSADILRALEHIARYLDEHCVDVLLVAGDVFSDRSRDEHLRAAIGEIKRIFTPFLARGGTVVAISGNHDREVFFETLRDALDLAAPSQDRAADTHPPGRLYLAPNASLLRLADAQGTVVQFVLLPYPTPRNYLRGEKISFHTIEERHRAMRDKFMQVLAQLQNRLDPRVPSVLVSHIHVRGVQPHSLYRLTEVEDVLFEPQDIPTHWAYVAYGHIHRAQPALTHASHVRYAGSVERLSANESSDEKSVTLFEIVGTERVGEPLVLPLDATPIYQIEIRDPDAELGQLVAQYPEASRALVKYKLHYDPARHNREALVSELDTLFPRWYDRELIESGDTWDASASFDPERIYDVAGTVRDYLGQQLEAHADHAELLTLADELLSTDDSFPHSVYGEGARLQEEAR